MLTTCISKMHQYKFIIQKTKTVTTTKQTNKRKNTPYFLLTNDHIYICFCTHTVYNNHKAIASVTIHENI